MLTLTGFGFTPTRATSVTPNWTPAPLPPSAPVDFVPPSPPIIATPPPPPPPLPVKTLPSPYPIPPAPSQGPTPPPPPMETPLPGAGPQITPMPSPSTGPFDLFSWEQFAWWKPVAVASVIAIFGGSILAFLRLRKR